MACREHAQKTTQVRIRIVNAQLTNRIFTMIHWMASHIFFIYGSRRAMFAVRPTCFCPRVWGMQRRRAGNSDVQLQLCCRWRKSCIQDGTFEIMFLIGARRHHQPSLFSKAVAWPFLLCSGVMKVAHLYYTHANAHTHIYIIYIYIHMVIYK